MNNVKILINELGPVKKQVIELKPVMLFTGESSLGKSYVNFLTYYLFHVFLSERMYDFLMKKMDTNVYENKDFSFDLNSSELINWMQYDVKKFFVYLYNYDDFKCDVKFSFDGIDENYNIRTIQKNIRNDSERIYVQLYINGEGTSFYAFTQQLERNICRSICRQLCSKFMGQHINSSYLLPPGRASLLTGDFTAQRGSSKLGLYDMFLHDNDVINSIVLINRLLAKKNDFFAAQVHTLIKGDLITEKDNMYLLTEDNQRIPLAAAASSIKELTPLLNLILSGTIANCAICIEEPEAHLHPEMQIAIADLLAACINEKVSMQITTHSDYFLQRINQLLKYGYIKEQNPTRYQEICKKNGHLEEHYLDKNDVNAYYFISNDGMTKIKSLPIGNNGIPMSTFFNTVKILSNEDDFLDEELEKLSI